MLTVFVHKIANTSREVFTVKIPAESAANQELTIGDLQTALTAKHPSLGFGRISFKETLADIGIGAESIIDFVPMIGKKHIQNSIKFWKFGQQF